MEDQEQPPLDLKEWRKANRLTQQQAATLFGLTLRGYGQMEREGRGDWRTVYAARFLGEHPEEIRERLKDTP